METFEVKIINPKAAKLLKGLEELKLISIKDTKQELAAILKKQRRQLKSGSADPNDIYPFRPQFLKFEGASYILREKLEGIVSFEENQYIISNELLGISVWGDSRDKAEEAFAFAFHSLYCNFAKEDDKKLTTQARKLKRTLLKLVVNGRDT